MTTGSKTRDLGSYLTNIYYYATEASTVGVLNNTNVPITRTSSKTWSGTDRPVQVISRPRDKGERRYYTVPETVRTKYGKDVTVLRRRYFYTRPIPNRVERAARNQPHAYSMSSELRLDRVVRTHVSSGAYLKQDASAYHRNAWPTSSLPSFTANDQIKLVGKLRGQMRGSDFNLAVFLGEGHQTVNMITHTALRLATAGLYARKGNFKAAKAALLTGRPRTRERFKDHSANSWLELQYGWLPLLSDMKEGAEQLAHILHYPKTKRYQVRMKLKTEYIPGNFSFDWVTKSRTVSRQIVAYITEPESLLSVSGLLDPELVAWELLPFSFVADWVIPLGDYLEARAYSRRLTGTFVTTDFTREHYLGLSGQKRNDGIVSWTDPNDIELNRVTMSRTVSTTLSVPLPQVKPLSKIASWQHMANATALLVQVFKGASVKGLDKKVGKLTRDATLRA